MRIRFHPRWLLVPTLLFLLPICQAQAQVPPSISFDLGGTNSPDSSLWDLNGSYTLQLTVNERNGTPVPVQLSFTLVQSGSGQLSTPTNDIEGLVINSNSVFAVTSRITGKVTGSAGAARVQLNIRFSGNGNLGGLQGVGVNGSLSLTAETAPGSTDLVGTKTVKFSAKFSNGSSVGGTVDAADFDTPLPPGVDGSWNMTLKIVPSSPLSGTAIATTAADAWGFVLSGNNKGGVLNVKARGASNVPNTLNASGSSANILLSSPFDSIQFNKSKILGQNVSGLFSQD